MLQSRDGLSLGEEFNRPVESIMRCEDFKSNFARRLSNRYISRPISTPRPETSLKICRLDSTGQLPNNAPERIEQRSQLSKTRSMEQNAEAAKTPDKPTLANSDLQRTEVTALNMEVDTLRWQLAQTEANRQMHTALLKEIVTFLNRVKEHIEGQNDSVSKKCLSPRVLPSSQPRSFSSADLPRSKSVLHVNKSLEYTLTSAKKINTRTISKSISNVDGAKDFSGIWSQSKLSLIIEAESSQKITEEMSRLITLANTVLSTKLPDLACTCNDSLQTNSTKPDSDKEQTLSTSLSLIEEDINNPLILNTICDTADDYTFKKFIDTKDRSLNFTDPPSSLSGLRNDFINISLNEKENPSSIKELRETPIKNSIDKKNNYNIASNFIEDESGFSSMSSFQEIGIPIISIIPPSPCKEVTYMEEIQDNIGETEKWKADAIELDKQTVKVFWV